MPEAVDPTGALSTLLLAGVAVAFVCWLLSVLFDEYSWTDRVWSLAPVGYVAYAAYVSELHPRLLLMSSLVALWGARLTFNYARKGGYAPGGEDYRWRILRGKMPGWAWPLFNLGFIAGYQNLLLVLISLPALRAASVDTPLGPLDAVAAGLFLVFLLGETVADQQQWRFHQRKAAGEAEKAYNDTGLWAWSRHPNFVCEQAQWWVLTLFPVAAGEPWLSVDNLLGAVLLTLLFLGSTRFTEQITASRTPGYADYQARVAPLLPWPRRT